MTKDLHNMLERFPDQRKKIIDLYSKNEDFRTLCEDYWQSKKALVKSRDKKISDALLENEYSGLCLELEMEALRFIRLVSR
jgi:hypothetical protein